MPDNVIFNGRGYVLAPAPDCDHCLGAGYAPGLTEAIRGFVSEELMLCPRCFPASCGVDRGLVRGSNKVDRESFEDWWGNVWTEKWE